MDTEKLQSMIQSREALIKDLLEPRLSLERRIELQNRAFQSDPHLTSIVYTLDHEKVSLGERAWMAANIAIESAHCIRDEKHFAESLNFFWRALTIFVDYSEEIAAANDRYELQVTGWVEIMLAYVLASQPEHLALPQLAYLELGIQALLDATEHKMVRRFLAQFELEEVPGLERSVVFAIARLTMSIRENGTHNQVLLDELLKLSKRAKASMRLSAATAIVALVPLGLVPDAALVAVKALKVGAKSRATTKRQKDGKRKLAVWLKECDDASRAISPTVDALNVLKQHSAGLF